MASTYHSAHAKRKPSTKSIETRRPHPGRNGARDRRSGHSRQSLTRLVEAGKLERITRGIYRLPQHSITEHHGLVLASTTAPQATICLLSALQFHGIGTQIPSQVWIAIDRRAHQPSLKFPPLRVMRYSGAALTSGVEIHRLEGRSVRIYGVAKTIADCFKYRNKIGLDVALEALREAWREKRFTMDELYRQAQICRVQRVIRPYLEVIAA